MIVCTPCEFFYYLQNFPGNRKYNSAGGGNDDAEIRANKMPAERTESNDSGHGSLSNTVSTVSTMVVGKVNEDHTIYVAYEEKTRKSVNCGRRLFSKHPAFKLSKK